ncbi:phage tail sheath family protein [Pseudomonas schmalbachii]|uniref:Phage tail sheath family protein n=1 Tax=Pseudomonas schmalbachii TaxID=2816993 RepID=A0ABS3TM52_9PSED|nr:phage tail sheath C-terminal domain-containing protein [Pseudomonas schmalbachii]MBO3274746.1 phage tail sheath family protein [Pseudomonas schmalbachii]
MPSYSTPGVYVEEIPVFPPSVAPVATAIPAFIGYTEKAVGKQGEDLTKTAVRLTSLLEYEAFFGKPPVQDMAISVNKRVTAGGRLLGVAVSWTAKPAVPTQFLHYAMQLYFANGGGPCYIYSVGAYGNASKTAFTDAITALEAVDEPTLLVFPDAVKLANDGDYGSVVDAALTSCNKTQDRFTIADVRNAIAGGTDDNAKVTTNFRAKVTKNTVEFLKYGAAYFPYVNTNVPFASADANVTLTAFNTVTVADDGSETTAPVADAAGKKLNDATLDIKGKETAVYSAIQAFIGEAYVTLPPSGAIAGVYAQVDRTRGVWKAPANVGLSLVLGPAVNATNDLQDGLNIDATTGKSVNVIRAFFGKGTLVWGGRTLAGNDNEWRYINVRRFANFVEESVRKAVGVFVFEPNDANTWVKTRTMIENFLINQWRDGALMGAKPEQAFRVVVGLGQTMSADDILNGLMIVEVHLAIVRPAEFIVLRFMQKMPEA